jgi:hypothetical protein
MASKTFEFPLAVIDSMTSSSGLPTIGKPFNIESAIRLYTWSIADWSTVGMPESISTLSRK